MNSCFPEAVRRGSEAVDPGEARRERMLAYYDPMRMDIADPKDARSGGEM